MYANLFRSTTGQRFRILSVGLIAILMLLATHFPGVAATSAPKAYVGLFKDNAVAVFDTSTNKVLTTIPVPTGPHGLVMTPDGHTLYVSSDGDSKVSVIDTATDTITATIEVGKTPHGLAITPDGKQVLSAVYGIGMVVVIDTASNKIVGQMPVPNPHNIAISHDGQTAYVASQQADTPALVIFDLAKMTQTATVPLDKGKAPRALNFSPDGKQLYFTQNTVDAVQVLDTATNKVVTAIKVGASPHHPFFTAEYGLVVSQTTGELAVIDPGTNTVKWTIGVGKMPHWIATSADGKTAYVTDEGSDDVSVVDIEAQKVIATIAIGHGPRKIVVQPNPAAPTEMAATEAATATN